MDPEFDYDKYGIDEPKWVWRIPLGDLIRWLWKILGRETRKVNKPQGESMDAL